MGYKVSVVITSYNRGDLLMRAVNSALAQTYHNIEVIVVDDNSNDEKTLQILDFLESVATVKVYRNSKNMGANYSRNFGINNSTGYFYTGLDDDDYFYPERVELLLENYTDDLAFVCDNYKLVNNEKVRKRFFFGKTLLLKHLCYSNSAGNQVLTTIDKIKSAGLFDVELKRLQDQDMWLRLLFLYGKAKRLNKCSYFMDVSHDNPRITNDVNSAETYQIFYNKHKEVMSFLTRLRSRNRIAFLKGGSVFVISNLVSPVFFIKGLLRTFVKR